MYIVGEKGKMLLSITSRVCCLFVWVRVLLCSPGYPGCLWAHSTQEYGLKLLIPLPLPKCMEWQVSLPCWQPRWSELGCTRSDLLVRSHSYIWRGGGDTSWSYTISTSAIGKRMLNPREPLWDHLSFCLPTTVASRLVVTEGAYSCCTSRQ